MRVELKTGLMEDFFASAKATAKEIDTKKKVTEKHIIWVDPLDLLPILQPERARMIQYLRERKTIT